MFVVFLVIVLPQTKLIIVQGEKEQLFEKSSKPEPFFARFYGFFSLHSISQQEQTAYGQMVEL